MSSPIRLPSLHAAVRVARQMALFSASMLFLLSVSAQATETSVISASTPGQMEQEYRAAISRWEQEQLRENSSQAIMASQKALSLAEQRWGRRSTQVADALSRLGETHYAQDDYEQAERLLIEALDIYEQMVAPDDERLAHCLNLLAMANSGRGLNGKAKPLAQRALRILEKKKRGAVDAEIASTLNTLAMIINHQGDFKTAEAMYLDAAARFDRLGGSKLRDASDCRENLIFLYKELDQFQDAERLLDEVLAFRRRTLPPDDPTIADLLISRADLLAEKGNFAAARQEIDRAIPMYEKSYGNNTPQYANSILGSAPIFLEMREFDLAEAILQRGLRILEKAYSPKHPHIMVGQVNLASLYMFRGQYEMAHQQLKSVREKLQRLFGEYDVSLATILNNEASLYYAQGSYQQAEVSLHKALELNEKRYGKVHGSLVESLNNLGHLYLKTGNYDQSEECFKRTLKIREELFGVEHSAIGSPLNGLTLLYQAQGKLTLAEQQAQRVLRIFEKSYGPQNLQTATSRSTLAGIYFDLNQVDRAIALQRHSLRTFADQLGEDNLFTALSRRKLGRYLLFRGKNTVEVLAMQQRAHEALRRALPPQHPTLAESHQDLAITEFAHGHIELAIAHLRQGMKIREQLLEIMPSEIRTAAQLAAQRQEEERIYSLVLTHPQRGDVRKLVLELSLLRKGLDIELARRVRRELLRGQLTGSQQALLSQLNGLRNEYLRLAYGNPKQLAPALYQEQLKRLGLKLEEVELKLAAQSPELAGLRQATRRDIVSEVAHRLAPDEVFIDVVRTRKDAMTSWWKSQSAPPGEHYVALLLRPDGKILVEDLGDSEVLDSVARSLREQLATPDSSIEAAAKRAYERFFARLAPHLGRITMLRLALEGELQLLPFAALHDGHGYLLWRYRFHYLTSGRDLLGAAEPPAHAGPLIVGPPDFYALQPGSAEGPPALPGQQSGLYAQLQQLERLQGMAAEAEALGKLLPNARMLAGKDASERNLRKEPPSILMHFATHGVFLADQVETAGEVRLPMSRNMVTPVGPLPDAGRWLAPLQRISPLSRSALLLAGAAEPRNQTDPSADGVLTAEEVLGMNCSGTQSVVMSACETGRGEVRIGQGVYGLRRAFLIAGAESVISSQWQVSDADTVELMKRFYQNLLACEPRVVALHKAMKSLAGNVKLPRHPYYWAPFLVLGRDGPIRLAESCSSGKQLP